MLQLQRKSPDNNRLLQLQSGLLASQILFVVSTLLIAPKETTSKTVRRERRYDFERM
jgi:hypothetical protein